MRARVAVILVLAFLLAPNASAQDEQPGEESPEALAGEIAAKESELAAIAEKIGVLRKAREAKEGEKERLTGAVELLEDRVREAQLELDRTTVSVEEARLRIRATQLELDRLTKQQTRLREQLSEVVRLLSVLDRRSPLETLLTGGTFADFLGNTQALARLHDRTTGLLVRTHDLRRARETREAELKQRHDELGQLAQLQAAQKESLRAEEGKKRHALARTTAEAAKVAGLLAEALEARREIQAEVFVLKNAGVRLSLKQAEEFASYAGAATGVRPALLLGVLKVESNIGTNVGSGRYPDDVHPDHREALVRVTEQLGLDPTRVPVSAKPTTYQGWGGALGPGQILPGIWERIAPEVARLTGKERANPFELLDAFVGTAVILRNAGAASGNEFEAVNRYFAGPNWARFTWYGDRVLAVAKEYETRGL